ncbi:MAG: PHB depolymerase family esterase [Deltaproteobacteria bacterium]|nr:PHB depolymerase family esterase [Deltaproteobacteria bacterium]
MPLVVALHGCFQSGADYQLSTGWDDLADRYGFMVVYPHKTGGTIGTCWDHAATGTGNPNADMTHILGIIDEVKGSHHIDSNRVYVTGLSAGGGLTYCLMEFKGSTFAGGAPMAAPQCGTKGNPVSEAMIIWHSSSDGISQGAAGFSRFGGAYSGAQKTVTGSRLKQGNTRHSYDAFTLNGKHVVGLVTMSNPHGIAVDPGNLDDQGGTTGSYASDQDIWSSYYTAQFWGLLSTQPITTPAVNITFPASGAQVSGTLTIEATATDDQSVERVEFYVDGQLKCTDGTGPYTCVWDTSLEPSGSHALMAKAYDPSGAVGTDDDTSVSIGISGRDAGPLAGPDSGPLGPDAGAVFTCEETYASNYAHVQSGRAERCGTYLTNACTAGGGDDLGAWSLSISSWVREVRAGYFEAGRCEEVPGEDASAPDVSVTRPDAGYLAVDTGYVPRPDAGHLAGDTGHGPRLDAQVQSDAGAAAPPEDGFLSCGTSGSPLPMVAVVALLLLGLLPRGARASSRS